MDALNVGDRVLIYDVNSDLVKETGEIVLISKHKAAVMLNGYVRERGFVGRSCIVDWFDADNLYAVHRSRGL